LLIVAVLNSSYLLFPIFIGSVILCEEFAISFFYIIVFGLLHNIKIIWLFLIMLLVEFVVKKNIVKIISIKYEPIFLLIFIYLGLFLVFKKVDYLVLYLIYNFGVDLLMVRLCARR
jgi:hypothetical protein